MKDIKFILNEMTIEEKARVLTGIDALSTVPMEKYDIPRLEMSDGPHGIRRLVGHPSFPQECNIDGGDVCFPTASALGSSWNRELAFKTGEAIAKDCIQEGIDMLLAPAVNMKRTPHCGRNFEYFSEDPYLSGIMGAEFINGVQSQNVGTSLKHYAVNSQEINRGTINAEVDERTLREYYLKVFEILLGHCNPTSVMCAYNKLNGIWCSENKYLLTELLKEEWGYDGLVVSDWGAVHNISKAIKAGLDLQMPRNKDIIEEIKEGIENGIITEEDLDRAVFAVLRFTEKIESMRSDRNADYSRESQHRVAYEAACETITLLKNDNDVLPLSKGKYNKIAVLGRCAEDVIFMGGGSSKVSIEKDSVDVPIEFIKKNASDYGIELDYFPVFADAFLDEGVLAKVDAVNDSYDCALLFLGDNYGTDAETESFDRDNIKLPNYMNAVVEKVASKFKNTVLILQSGSAIIPYRWDGINAIVQMWYSGEAAGSAVADILFGKVNPSGKLSETFMKVDRNDLDYPGDGIKINYYEKQNVGYRYYDKHKDEIYFPFGHGLSYTEFEYSNIQVDKTVITDDEFTVNVTFDVKNTGKVFGKEAVQLYISPLDNVIDRPIKELRKFDKISLNPGESKTVSFELTQKDFVYYNTCLHDWHIESGCYDILVGASSQDIRLKDTMCIKYISDYTKFHFDNSMVL